MGVEKGFCVASKRALVVRGGWEGHQPVAATDLFLPFLRDNGYEVQIEGSPAVYADTGTMRATDLILQAQVPDKPFPAKRIAYPWAMCTQVSRDGGLTWSKIPLKPGENGLKPMQALKLHILGDLLIHFRRRRARARRVFERETSRISDLRDQRYRFVKLGFALARKSDDEIR